MYSFACPLFGYVWTLHQHVTLLWQCVETCAINVCKLAGLALTRCSLNAPSVCRCGAGRLASSMVLCNASVLCMAAAHLVRSFVCVWHASHCEHLLVWPVARCTWGAAVHECYLQQSMLSMAPHACACSSACNMVCNFSPRAHGRVVTGTCSLHVTLGIGTAVEMAVADVVHLMMNTTRNRRVIICGTWLLRAALTRFSFECR